MRATSLATWASMAALALAVSCAGEQREETTVRGALAAPALPSRPTAPRPEAEGPAVVLVVLDGVRWQDVFVGADPHLSELARVPATKADLLMPHLHALVADRGAAVGAPGEGPPMVATGPNFVSLPGYNEIFSGRSPTRCKDNDCPQAEVPTLADEVLAMSGRPSDVAVITSWPKIERASSAAPAGFVVSAGRSHVQHAEILRGDDVTRQWLDAGAEAPPYPGYDDYRPDVYTAEIALRYLETRRPRFLFIGLGEPDEYAHRDDYAGYLGSLRKSDDVVGTLFEALDRMGARGQHTTVVVTADHGRGRDYRVHGRSFPESNRVWMVAAGGGVAARGFVRSSRPHRLADVAPTVRQLLGLPADTSASAGAPIDELFTPAPQAVAVTP